MLHGKIEVNDVAVGYWAAVRGESIMKNTHRYHCNVYYRNNEGYPLRAEFPVVHYEPAGAVALAAMILSSATRNLKGLNLAEDREPDDFPV